MRICWTHENTGDESMSLKTFFEHLDSLHGSTGLATFALALIGSLIEIFWEPGGYLTFPFLLWLVLSVAFLLVWGGTVLMRRIFRYLTRPERTRYVSKHF